MRRIALAIMALFVMTSVALGEEDPVSKLADTTISYFKPLTGVVTQVEGGKAIIAAGEKDGVRVGMRLKVLREGAPFIHPVTKELLGKVESAVGKMEIKDVQAGTSTGVMVEGDVLKGDRVRISDTKVRVLFCQDKSIDWSLADEYYRKLKGTSRIEMVDTALETDDAASVLAEARRLGTEVALILTAKEAEKGMSVRERLYWVSDGSKFIDAEMVFSKDFSKELKFGSELFTARSGEAEMMYDLSFGATLVATGDIYGDGKQEILLSTGRDVRAYRPSVDLQFLWQIKGPASEEQIWLDTIDLNKNGRDEVVITAKKSNDVVSYIYEFTDSGFKLMWQGNYFLRKAGAILLAQAYSGDNGFSGDIFTLTWNGDYKIGDKIKVPKGVNIYDFINMEGPSGERLIFSYDDNGFLNLYDDKGIRVWMSKSNTGGFLKTYKRRASVSYLEPGEWAVKDRLFQRQKEVMAVERSRVSDTVKGIGYKSSRIRSYWWNGFSMDEGVLIDDIKGTLLDYAPAGDRLVVLASPFLGIKFGNILKGENPLGTVLYIYSIKGR